MFDWSRVEGRPDDPKYTIKDTVLRSIFADAIFT
jgi:hypothetical protein